MSARAKQAPPAAERPNLPDLFLEVRTAIKHAYAASCLLFDMQFGILQHYRQEDLDMGDCLFDMASNTITDRMREAAEKLQQIEVAVLHTAPTE